MVCWDEHSSLLCNLRPRLLEELPTVWEVHRVLFTYIFIYTNLFSALALTLTKKVCYCIKWIYYIYKSENASPQWKRFTKVKLHTIVKKYYCISLQVRQRKCLSVCLYMCVLGTASSSAKFAHSNILLHSSQDIPLSRAAHCNLFSKQLTWERWKIQINNYSIFDWHRKTMPRISLTTLCVSACLLTKPVAFKQWKKRIWAKSDTHVILRSQSTRALCLLLTECGSRRFRVSLQLCPGVTLKSV